MKKWHFDAINTGTSAALILIFFTHNDNFMHCIVLFGIDWCALRQWSCSIWAACWKFCMQCKLHLPIPGEKPYKIFQDLQRSFRIFKDLQKLGFFKVLWRILHRSSKILNNFQRSCSFKILQRSSEGSFKIHKNLTKILIESHFLLSRKILKRSLQGSSKIYNDFMRILLRSLVRYSKDLCMDPWRSF